MDKWDEYVSEQYEEYMAQNCTCATSDEECPCMTLQQFNNYCLDQLEEYKEALCEYEDSPCGVSA